MNSPINIMLVEDSPAYRKVISLALRDESDLELTHQFGTAEVALRTLEDSTLANKPDLILLDLRLPGMGGLEAIPWIRKYVPATKIIILSQSGNEADVLQAIQQGVAGYLLKSSTATQLIEGIRSTFRGGASLDASVSKIVMDQLQRQIPQGELEQALSQRETEILTLLAQGFVKKEIAERLRIRYGTVDTHVKKIYEKMAVNNAPAAVNKGHRLGLFPPNEKPL